MTPRRTDETRTLATHPSPEVMDLPVAVSYVETPSGTYAEYASFWTPDPAELEALMRGGAVKVTIAGILPPQKVEVVTFD